MKRTGPLSVPVLVATALLLCVAPAHALDRVDAFVASLDRRVPGLLLRYGVPSAVVSVVHNGRTATRAWGVADIASGRAPSDATVYNVASISKVITAWGVMRLVEGGRVDLDAPISRYVTRWALPPSESNNQITVRRLLSHTSGLSMSAVPWYGPAKTVPALPEMLSDPHDPLRLIDAPGAAYHYSGGGYALLQLLIEEVAGESYESFIERAVLRPLGMTHSTFRTPEGSNDDAAKPYDDAVRALPHFRFAANAAAGLYTTAEDLARFAAASAAPSFGAGVLRPSTVMMMETRVRPEKDDMFGNGLGYAVVPLPVGGGTLLGHSGSNEGWMADWSLIPESGDALVVLLNRSGSFPVYRDLLCDWVNAANGARWQGFCDAKTTSWSEADGAFVDELFASTTAADPAAAVLVANAEGVVYRKAFGARDLSSASAASPDTPFYVASVAKSMTAMLALDLVAEGRWSLGDPIGRFLSDLPGYLRGATIDELLSHTSGVPDYHELIDWSRYDGMDNAKAIALLGTRKALNFPSGSTYAYSNSGYLLIASAIERVTGQPYRSVLRSRVLAPLGMNSTSVDDGYEPPPPGRALGYKRDGGRYVLGDYHVATIDGHELDFRSSTIGSGGMYSTVDDLYALDRALYTDHLVPLSLEILAMSPRTKVTEALEVAPVIGHGLGWFTSQRSGRNFVWNSGDFAGHHAALLRVPDQQFVVVVLTSSAERKAIDIATRIADHVFAGSK
jgi:CubicO group peptidase (beta-lactamase class C family)